MRTYTIPTNVTKAYPVPVSIVVSRNRKGRLVATARTDKKDLRVRDTLNARFPDQVRGLRWKAGVWMARLKLSRQHKPTTPRAHVEPRRSER